MGLIRDIQAMDNLGQLSNLLTHLLVHWIIHGTGTGTAFTHTSVEDLNDNTMQFQSIYLKQLKFETDFSLLATFKNVKFIISPCNLLFQIIKFIEPSLRDKFLIFQIHFDDDY